MMRVEEVTLTFQFYSFLSNLPCKTSATYDNAIPHQSCSRSQLQCYLSPSKKGSTKPVPKKKTQKKKKKKDSKQERIAVKLISYTQKNRTKNLACVA